MKLLAALSLMVFAAGISAVDIMIETMDGSILEGEPMVVVCRIAVADPTRDIVSRLFVAETSIAEDKFDAEPVSNYKCTIPAGQTVGSVSIPTIIDNVFDDGEVFVIGGIPQDPIDTSSMMAPFALTDVPSGRGTDITIRPRELVYEGSEGGNISIIIEFYDDLGKNVPLEVDYMLNFNFLDITATGGTANGPPDDYDNSDTGGIMLLGSMNGIATVFSMITIPLVDDGLPENSEVFAFTLVDASVTGVIVDETVVYRVTIMDVDKPGFYVLNQYTLLPRRSRKPVKMVVFTTDVNEGIDLTMAPRDTDYTVKALPDHHGSEFTFTRPKKRSRSRFTEYMFSTTEIANGMPYTHEAYTHISATNHRRGNAPINTFMGTTITAYPKGGSDRLETPVTLSVDPGDYRLRRRLRWSYYGDTGLEKRLHFNKRKTQLKLTDQSQAGLYVIFRFKRRDTGWVQYIRVLLAECPEGRYHTDITTPSCDGGPVRCQHGGVVDPMFSEGLCTCPPGYIGDNCDTPTDVWQFGNNGQYDVRDFFGGSGCGITFIFKAPFGSTCAPGCYGPGCMKDCKKAYFGPGCASKCNCVDENCSKTGVCENGCEAGYIGATCQDRV